MTCGQRGAKGTAFPALGTTRVSVRGKEAYSQDRERPRGGGQGCSLVGFLPSAGGQGSSERGWPGLTCFHKDSATAVHWGRE